MKHIEILNMARSTLTETELASLPDEGLVVWDEPSGASAQCPANGYIRQRRNAWNWHPTLDHARKAAVLSGEHTFLVGEGNNIEIKAWPKEAT